jgi:hypothetical protein
MHRCLEEEEEEECCRTRQSNVDSQLELLIGELLNALEIGDWRKGRKCPDSPQL